MKRKLALFLTVTMIAGLMAGCSGTSDTTSTDSSGTNSTDNAVSSEDTEREPVELTYFTQSTLLPKAQDQLNEALQEDLPWLSLDIMHVADNYETTLKTKFAAGDAPDIFNWNGYLSNKTFAEAGYLLDITDEPFVDNVMDQFKESGMYDGRVYGIPTVAQASGLIYNKDAFEKAGIETPPRTLSEVEEACESLKAVGITPFATGLKDVWVSQQLFWNVSGPNVGDFNTWYYEMADGNSSFRNPKTEETFKLIDIILANTIENPLSSDAANMSNDIATGKAGMCLQGVWQYDTFLKSDPNVRLGLAPIPVSENPDDAVMEYEAQEIVFAASMGEHTREAKEFMEWLTTENGVRALGEINKQASPINVDVEIDMNPLSQDADRWVKDGGRTVGFIKTFWPAGLTDEVGKQLQRYVAGTITEDQFFNNIDEAFVKLANQ